MNTILCQSATCPVKTKSPSYPVCYAWTWGYGVEVVSLHRRLTKKRGPQVGVHPEKFIGSKSIRMSASQARMLDYLPIFDSIAGKPPDIMDLPYRNPVQSSRQDSSPIVSLQLHEFNSTSPIHHPSSIVHHHLSHVHKSSIQHASQTSQPTSSTLAPSLTPSSPHPSLPPIGISHKRTHTTI